MPEKVVIYTLQCALCSLFFFTLSSVQCQLPAKLSYGWSTQEWEAARRTQLPSNFNSC